MEVIEVQDSTMDGISLGANTIGLSYYNLPEWGGLSWANTVSKKAQSYEPMQDEIGIGVTKKGSACSRLPYLLLTRCHSGDLWGKSKIIVQLFESNYWPCRCQWRWVCRATLVVCTFSRFNKVNFVVLIDVMRVHLVFISEHLSS